MAEDRVQRRLAAILAADVVGYSRLMQVDEVGTLAALKARRKEIVGPLVARHQGRIFKVTGDGVMVEFASAVNAVQCAVDLQEAMAAAAREQPEDRRIVLRIGINLGDVVVERGDLYGDGVNIAARLESAADPGGIYVSGSAYDQVRNKTEAAFDKGGQQLPFDPNGLDTEGLVRLKDGTFWIGEEYGPSLVHVAADGKIIERLVPQGLEGDLSGTTYTVTGSLPSILMKRQLNRGIEGIALAPDESALYTIVQNPLANPDADAYKTASATRILKLDLANRQVVGEYVYTLDPAESFKNDKSDKQSDVRISELTAVGVDQLVVLERIAKTTKLQAIDLSAATNILGTDWDKAETAPSLEQIAAADLVAKGVTPVTKKLWLDSSTYPELPEKVEGVAIVDGKELVLINDDDFGIEGAKTRIVRITMPSAAF